VVIFKKFLGEILDEKSGKFLNWEIGIFGQEKWEF
jgi:hypothetical protein